MTDQQISFSQCGEDIIMLFLAEHILHLEEIYYLDLGANDPMKFNNTYLFYKKGWHGVSVDPNSYFKKLYKSTRPDDKFVCAGVGVENSKIKFFEIEPHTLSTFSEQEAKYYTSSGVHTIKSIENKPVHTVEKILKKYCRKKPNLMTIDIEGFDLEILKSINFSDWKPDIICAETLEYSPSGNGKKIKSIIKLLEDVGYIVYADTYINTIFVSKESWERRLA